MTKIKILPPNAVVERKDKKTVHICAGDFVREIQSAVSQPTVVKDAIPACVKWHLTCCNNSLLVLELRSQIRQIQLYERIPRSYTYGQYYNRYGAVAASRLPVNWHTLAFPYVVLVLHCIYDEFMRYHCHSVYIYFRDAPLTNVADMLYLPWLWNTCTKGTRTCKSSGKLSYMCPGTGMYVASESLDEIVTCSVEITFDAPFNYDFETMPYGYSPAPACREYYKEFDFYDVGRWEALTAQAPETVTKMGSKKWVEAITVGEMLQEYTKDVSPYLSYSQLCNKLISCADVAN